MDPDERGDTKAILLAPRAPGDPDNILYQAYNNCPMKTHQFITTGNSTGWKNIKTEVKTKDTVKLVKDVSITIGSLFSQKLTYFTTATSVLDAFLSYANLTGPNLATNSKDYFQARLVWVSQYTYRDWAGEWQCGLVTYKVLIKKLSQETHFKKPV